MSQAPAHTALTLQGPRRARLRSTSPGLLLVANANASGLAGHGELVRGAESLLRRAGARVEQRVTESIGELATLLRHEGGDRRVVLLGGDGTLHAVANLPDPPREVALLPAGRANNVARSLGIPTELEAAAALATHGRTRSLDLIAATSAGRRYLAVEGVSVGFLAHARARYRSVSSADLGAGMAAGAAALAHFRPLCVAIESDGSAEVARVGQLFVANLPLYGFGLRVAPNADPADGLLDLVAVKAASRGAVVAMLARLRRGTHVGRPGVRVWRARSIRIGSGGRSPVIADSTNLGTARVQLSVVPAALAVVAPGR